MRVDSENTGMRLIGGTVGLGLIVGAFLQEKTMTFESWPSGMMLLISLFLFLSWKYGKAGLLFFKQEAELRDRIVYDGYIVTSVLAGVALVSNLVTLLNRLPEQAAIGPSLAYSVQSLIYPIFIIVFIFFPYSTRSLPVFVIFWPIIGVLLTLLTLFILLVSF